MSLLYQQLDTTKCSCCKVRYAKQRYSTGSYCEQCLKHLYNPGRYISSYNPRHQNFNPARPDQIECKSCELCWDRGQIKKIRFQCGHNFTYCINCAVRQEFCPIDGAAVTNESLSHFA